MGLRGSGWKQERAFQTGEACGNAWERLRREVRGLSGCQAQAVEATYGEPWDFGFNRNVETFKGLPRVGPSPSSRVILAPGLRAGAASWGLVPVSGSLVRRFGDRSEVLVQIFWALVSGGRNEPWGRRGRRDTPALPQDSWHN